MSESEKQSTIQEYADEIGKIGEDPAFGGDKPYIDKGTEPSTKGKDGTSDTVKSDD